MSSATRLVVGGVLVTLAEAAAAAVALMTLGVVRVSLFLVACTLATAAMTAIVHRLSSPGPRPGGGDSDGGPPARGPDPPPPWWPEFERAFREHVERRDRTKA